MIGASTGTLSLVQRLHEKWPGTLEITVLNSQPFWFHEFMALEALSGTYGLRDIKVDLEPLLRAWKADFLQDKLASLLPSQQKVLTESGRLLSYDVLLFDAWPEVACPSPDIPVVGHYFLKPSYAVLEIVNELETLLELEQPGKIEIVILGGSATGVVAALQLEAWLRTRRHPHTWSITMIEERSRLLPHWPEQAAEITARFCRMGGISVLTDSAVEHVQSNRVVMNQGRTVPFDLAVRTYPECERWVFEKMSLPTDDDGRVRTNAMDQVEGFPAIFSMGESSHGSTHWPVSGSKDIKLVARNLMAFLEGQKLRPRPRKKPAAQMLPLDKVFAMIVRGKKAIYGRWCLKMLHWQQQRAMKKWHELERAGAAKLKES